jgi:hypothetical protein
MRVFWSDGHISIGRSDRCDR